MNTYVDVRLDEHDRPLSDYFFKDDLMWDFWSSSHGSDEDRRPHSMLQFEEWMEMFSPVATSSDDGNEPANLMFYDTPKPDESWDSALTLLAEKKYWFSHVRIFSTGELILQDGISNFTNKYFEGGNSYTYFGYTKIVGNSGDNIIMGADTFLWEVDGKEIFKYHFNDLIYGGDGNDIIYGCAGDDRLFGEGDHDILFGGEGNDFLDGGAGNDILFGGNGYDVLIGGAGDDWLYAGQSGVGQGAEMYGGSGYDTFVIGAWMENLPPSAEDKPQWPDTLETVLTVGSVFVPKLKFVKGLVTVVNTLKDAFGTSKDSEPVGDGKHSITKIRDFNPLEDKILIPVGDTTDIGIYITSDSNPSVVMTIRDALGRVIAEISFAKPQDVFGSGVTSYSKDFIKAFVDQLKFGALMIGRDGAFYGLDNKQKLEVDAHLFEELGNNNFLLMGAFGGQEFYGGAGGDTVVGTNFGDIISGYNLDENAPGKVEHYKPDNDILYGFGGDDVFFGGAGQNSFHGGGGDDTASYQFANRGIVADMMKVMAGGYYEVVNGHMYKQNIGGQMVEVMDVDHHYDIENIIGSDQNDIIYGDNNDNIFVSGGGNDLLAGRGGADTFILTGGKNTIWDFNANQGDLIRIEMDVYDLVDKHGLYLTKVAHGNETHLINSKTGEIIAVLKGVDPNNVDLNKHVDVIDKDGNIYEIAKTSGNFNGTALNDFVIATETGSNTRQNIVGGKGDDILIATGRNKNLNGGDGDDILVIDAANASVVGGAGADAFVFAAGCSSAYIGGFNAKEGDALYLDFQAFGVKGVGDLTFKDSGGTVEIWSGNHLISWVGNSTIESVRSSIQDFSGSEHDWFM